jgi:CoA:oxalate CoA-transferase
MSTRLTQASGPAAAAHLGVGVSADSEHPYPLAGLRVLDLSRALSGPYVGRILGDLGADVVKVETPGQDIAQLFGRSSYPHSGLYTQLNAGKRSIMVDVRRSAGIEVVLRLMSRCDVVIENFRPGVMEAMGLGWEAVSAHNPRVVLLSISGFGQHGPEAQRRAYAPVIHAESGLLGRQAELDGTAPRDIQMALADSVAALHGSIAVLAALRLREQTGAGLHVDQSMLASLLATDDYLHYSLEGNLPPRPAAGLIFAHASGPILIAADAKFVWATLARVAGLVDPDPDAEPERKFAARRGAVAQWIAEQPDRAALTAALDAAGLAWANVRTSSSVLDSPTFRAGDLTVLVDDRQGGTRPVVRMPYRFSAATSGPRSGPPHCGEHTAAVLSGWLELPSEDIERMTRDGVVAVVAEPQARSTS